MQCAGDKCAESSTAPLFACYGPCGNSFHAKCIGSNNAFLDKVNSSKIACWYCADCKKTSPYLLAIKLSNFKLDIQKLSKGFEELLKTFNTSVSNLDSFSSPFTSAEISTSTEDLDPILADKPQESSDLNSQSSSSAATINAATTSASVQNKSSKRTRDGSAPIRNSSPPPKRKTLRSNSNKLNSNSNLPASLEPVLPECVSNDAPATIEPLAGSVALESIVCMEAVPKPKSVFVSRLRPEIGVNDVLSYLLSKKCISSTGSVKCMKISKSDSFVSSFKIFAPPTLFDSISNRETWPDGTLVKEFTVRNKNKNSSNPSPASKN